MGSSEAQRAAAAKDKAAAAGVGAEADALDPDSVSRGASDSEEEAQASRRERETGRKAEATAKRAQLVRPLPPAHVPVVRSCRQTAPASACLPHSEQIRAAPSTSGDACGPCHPLI